jgi:hypothetical protein
MGGGGGLRGREQSYRSQLGGLHRHDVVDLRISKNEDQVRTDPETAHERTYRGVRPKNLGILRNRVEQLFGFFRVVRVGSLSG